METVFFRPKNAFWSKIFQYPNIQCPPEPPSPPPLSGVTVEHKQHRRDTLPVVSALHVAERNMALGNCARMEPAYQDQMLDSNNAFEEDYVFSLRVRTDFF